MGQAREARLKWALLMLACQLTETGGECRFVKRPEFFDLSYRECLDMKKAMSFAGGVRLECVPQSSLPQGWRQ